MKSIARFLRKLADHIDPPPSKRLCFRVTLDTSEFDAALNGVMMRLNALQGDQP